MKVTYIFLSSYFLCLKFKYYCQTVCSRYLQANFKVCIHIVVKQRPGLEIYFSHTVAIPCFPYQTVWSFVSLLQGVDTSSIVLYCLSRDGEEIDRVRYGEEQVLKQRKRQ
jgi:hypothetical protein